MRRRIAPVAAVRVRRIAVGLDLRVIVATRPAALVEAARRARADVVRRAGLEPRVAHEDGRLDVVAGNAAAGARGATERCVEDLSALGKRVSNGR